MLVGQFSIDHPACSGVTFCLGTYEIVNVYAFHDVHEEKNAKKWSPPSSEANENSLIDFILSNNIQPLEMDDEQAEKVYSDLHIKYVGEHVQ